MSYQSSWLRQGEISCICSSPYAIITSGEDGVIRMWTTQLEPGSVFPLHGLGLNMCPWVQSVGMSMDGTKLLIGTRDADIFEVATVLSM